MAARKKTQASLIDEFNAKYLAMVVQFRKDTGVSVHNTIVAWRTNQDTGLLEAPMKAYTEFYKGTTRASS